MANLSFIFGIFGNIISILVFASPMKTFWVVVKKKSTENYKGVPYITTLLSTSLWTFYGILNPDGLLVMTVNGAGAVFQFVYVVIFLIYAPKDKKIKMAKLVGLLNVVFLGVVISVTLLVLHGKKRLTFVGIFCAALTIGMYAAPLSAMRMVIKTKSVQYMPFLLSFFLFLNGGIWSAYAVLVKDFYIGVPNAIGFVLGSVQLILYAMYKDKSKAKAMEEEGGGGSTNLVKKGVEMGAYNNNNNNNNGNNERNVGEEDEVDVENRSLTKGKSLPKPSINRQSSLHKILRTLSLNARNLQSDWVEENDIESEKVLNNI